MKRFLFLAVLSAAALAGIHAAGLSPLHGSPPPTPITVPPSRPRHWTLSIPRWHPVTDPQWARMSDVERFAADREARHAVEAAAFDDDGRAVVPGDAGPLVIDVAIELAKGQHTPTADAIRAAVERALESGAAIRGGWGSVRFTRSGSRGEYGVEVHVKEVR